jgi:hypothetical protein
MQDPFVGTWTLNVGKSQLDPSYVASAGTVVFEKDSESGYLMKAEGVTETGERVAERPQRFILDGQEHPVPDASGVIAIATRPDPNTIAAEARMNGAVVGHARYTVSPDGRTLTATAKGMGTKGPFQTTAVFDRQPQA